MKFSTLFLKENLFNDEMLETVKKAFVETLKEVKTWDDYEELIQANVKLLMTKNILKLNELLEDTEEKKGKKS